MPDLDKSALSRRSFVGKLATGAAGAVVALAATTGRSEATLHRERAAAYPDQTGIDFAAGIDTEKGSAVADMPQQVIVETGPPPWSILQPLAAGSTVSAGWQLTELTGVADGSCVFTLGNQRGRNHRVHLCRNDGQPQGLVFTKHFDLVVMNGGRGDLPTEEGFGQAVAAVAHLIAANESRGHHKELIHELLPQSEREQRFAATARLR